VDGSDFSSSGRLKTKKLVRMARLRQHSLFLLEGTWELFVTTACLLGNTLATLACCLFYQCKDGMTHLYRADQAFALTC
jgi:hypothetical protein